MPLAIVLHRYGPPEALQLEEVPRPVLAPDELRIRVLAAGVNRTDIEIRAGHWPILKDDPFPYIPGVEAVGDVIETGADVADFAICDVTITMMMGLGGVRAERAGGYQEELVVPAANCAKIPAGKNPRAIAAFGLAGVTALNGLQIAGAAAGRRILVTGGSGGVGSCALRIGKAFGAEMIAVTSDAAKEKPLRGFGADEVVCIPRNDQCNVELPEVDGIVDTVGGPLFGTLVEALKPGGRLCLVGGAAGEAVSFSAWALLRETLLTGWSSERLDGTSLRRDLATLMGLRHLMPPPPTLIPLSQAAAAHGKMESSAHVGRLLLVPDDSL
jgi:NADPH2:quinone reductase